MIEYIEKMIENGIFFMKGINLLPPLPESNRITDEEKLSKVVTKICQCRYYTEGGMKYLLTFLEGCDVRCTPNEKVFNDLFTFLIRGWNLHTKEDNTRLEILTTFKFILSERNMERINSLPFIQLFTEKFQKSKMWKETLRFHKWNALLYFNEDGKMFPSIKKFLDEDKYSSPQRFLNEHENVDHRIIHSFKAYFSLPMSEKKSEKSLEVSFISNYLEKNPITKRDILKYYFIDEIHLNLECYSIEELILQFLTDIDDKWVNYEVEKKDEYTLFLGRVSKNKKRWREMFSLFSSLLSLEKVKEENAKRVILLFNHWKNLIFGEVHLIEKCLSFLDIGDYSLIIEEIKKLDIPLSSISSLLRKIEKTLSPLIKEKREALPLLLLREVILNETLRIYRLRL